MSKNSYEIKKAFFDKGLTRNYDFRIEMLYKLQKSIKKCETDIIEALSLDLNKPIFEAYTAEIGILYHEINIAVKNLRDWMKPKKVSTPIFLQPSNSYIYTEPKGVILIISPWNYPFQLTISPLIGAIAAGNCALIKPSHKSPKVEKIISKIIKETFAEEYISTIEGPGSEVIDTLIEKYRFDHIFFTGSVNVGKKIMQLASKHLTPVTLELGGKSPTIVHHDSDIELAAKNITWAKFYNAGQTCVAPDYLLVHENVKEELIKNIKKYIEKYYGEKKNENIGRIINEDRVDKLISFLNKGNILEGGTFDKKERYIAPTLIDEVNLDDEIMKEEIFGPILPIFTYKDIVEVVSIVRENPYPLSLYLFTKDRQIEKYFIENIQFGGGCINNAISHLVNPNLPFGGVGYSGMGRYHAKYTFDEFSHEKSILKSKGKFEMDLKFPPYNEKKMKWVRKFLK